ncbi:MAG: AbrB/MazE/SpoVT family DNA-binding domain-containing protein [Gluconacetobacter diazotrophicus]|nr:AbrB/MazE/SpoVT family DNA-binding domain-containing protein [Gluconacetobacter diazotrophicus]
MQVARWGNSLAVRIPAHIVRELGLREGDSVEAVFRRLMSRQEALDDLATLGRTLPKDLRVERDRDAP